MSCKNAGKFFVPDQDVRKKNKERERDKVCLICGDFVDEFQCLI